MTDDLLRSAFCPHGRLVAFCTDCEVLRLTNEVRELRARITVLEEQVSQLKSGVELGYRYEPE